MMWCTGYRRDIVRSTGTPPTMEQQVSQSSSVHSDSAAETSFHEISKVIGRKTHKDGVDWIHVKWKKHPSKKYNSWVQASAIKKTYVTPASSSSDEISIGVTDVSIHVWVPEEVSSGSEDLDDTVIPSKPTPPASPVTVPERIEPTPERYDDNPFASQPRLATTPIKKSQISTPLASQPVKLTSTLTGDVTTMDIDDWDLTRVGDTTSNPTRRSLDPKEHLKRMESVLHNRVPPMPTNT